MRIAKLLFLMNSLGFIAESAKAPPTDTSADRAPTVIRGARVSWPNPIGGTETGTLILVPGAAAASGSPYEDDGDGAGAADAAAGASTSSPKIFQDHQKPPARAKRVPGALTRDGQVIRLSPGEYRIQAAYGRVEGPDRTLPTMVTIKTPKKAQSFAKVYEANRKILQDKGIVNSGDSNTAIASAIQKKLQSAAKFEAVTISPDVQKAMMVVMARLEYQNSAAKEPDPAISEAFHALNAAVGGNDFRTMSPSIAGELSPAEAYYIGSVNDRTWSADLTRQMVPRNVDPEDVAKYADQYRKSTRLPADATIPKNWSSFSSLIHEKLTIESDPHTMTINRITFDGQSIVRGDNGWTGDPDTDGGDRFIRKLAAAMYATGNVHTPTMEAVIQKMAADPEADPEAFQKARATEALLRIASGKKDPNTGQPTDRVDGSTFDGALAPEGSIIHGGATPATFANRRAFFLATALDLGGLTNAQIIGHLQTVSPDLQEAIDRVSNHFQDEHDTEAKERILRNAVMNIQPSADAYKFGDTWVLAQDLWDGRMDVRDFLYKLKSGADLHENEQAISESMKRFPNLRLDNQVRAAMLYNSFKDNSVDLPYATSLVITADTTHSSQAQKGLVKAVADKLGLDVESGLMGKITAARRDAVSSREFARWHASYAPAESMALNLAYIETNKAAKGTWSPSDIPPERQFWGADKPVNELDVYTYFQVTGKPLPSGARAGIWDAALSSGVSMIQVYEKSGHLVSQEFYQNHDLLRLLGEPARVAEVAFNAQAESWLIRNAAPGAQATVEDNDGSESTRSLSSLDSATGQGDGGDGRDVGDGEDGEDGGDADGFEGL